MVKSEPESTSAPLPLSDDSNLAGHPHHGRFALYLVGFMLSMLGLVLADDPVLLFVFWERTTFTSHLLPGSCHTPHFAVSAVFAGLLTKVGVYALILMFTLVIDHYPGFAPTIVLWVAVLTMVVGALGAAAQSDFRKILSFHIVSQIGYMVLGLALMTPLALVGAVFYLIHQTVVKANPILIAGVASRIAGSSERKRIGGLYATAPLLAALFVMPAFSLAGLPPPSGFWSKSPTVKAALEVAAWGVAAAVHFGDFYTGVRAVIVVLFLLLTAPIDSHMIARAAVSAGVPLWKGEDDLGRRNGDEG